MQPGEIVTWKDVVDSGRRPRTPRQGSLFRRPRDRQRSIERRRRLAASGPMPPHLAAKFTTGQLSVLRIVGDEVRARGRCTLCVDEIAARAGVCRRLAQGAMRLADELGLLQIKERRVSAFRNDTNVVTIVSREWLMWLRIGTREDAIFRHARSSSFSSAAPRGVERSKQGVGGVEFARSVPP